MTTMYTVFGTLNGDEQPQVRVDDVEVVQAELTDGVHHVGAEFTSHGDDAGDAFLRVAGIDEAACADAYDRLFHMLKLVLPTVWGAPTPTVRVELVHGQDELGRIDVEMNLVGWTRRGLEHAAQELGCSSDIALRGMVIR